MNQTISTIETTTEKTKIILLYRCFSLIFIIIGTICNLISAIVYSKKRMRLTSYSIYLFVLAIVDLSVTWVGNLRFILMFFKIDLNDEYINNNGQELYFSSGLDLRETSLIMCRLHRFLTYYLLQLSSCLLCLLSIDRFFGVVLVLKSSRYCTIYVAKRIIIATLLVLFIFNIHFLISMGYYEPTTEFDVNLNETIKILRLRCEPNPLDKFYTKFWTIFTWLDASLYSMIPFFIMLFCNFSIIYKIVRSRIQSKLVVRSQIRRNDTLKMRRLSKSMSIISTNIMLPSEKRISIIFLIISFSFLFLTMPISIIESFQLLFPNSPSSISSISIATLCMYMNHVINFFFYCALGPKFRNEVKKLFPLSLFPINKVQPYVFRKSKTISGGYFNKKENVNELKKVSSYPGTLMHKHGPMFYRPREFLSPRLNPFITLRGCLNDEVTHL
jgi:hypothetical protein